MNPEHADLPPCAVCGSLTTSSEALCGDCGKKWEQIVNRNDELEERLRAYEELLSEARATLTGSPAAALLVGRIVTVTAEGFINPQVREIQLERAAQEIGRLVLALKALLEEAEGITEAVVDAAQLVQLHDPQWDKCKVLRGIEGVRGAALISDIDDLPVRGIDKTKGPR